MTRIKPIETLESPGDVLKMKQGVVKQVKELVDAFNPNTLEPRETANTCFVLSVEMVKSCKEFGAIYILSVAVRSLHTHTHTHTHTQSLPYTSLARHNYCTVSDIYNTAKLAY